MCLVAGVASAAICILHSAATNARAFSSFVFTQDTAFVDSFLEQSRASLRAGYEATARALSAAGVPFAMASAGMFVWLDLRSLLPQEQPTFADERNLWQARVLRARGGEARCPCTVQHRTRCSACGVDVLVGTTRAVSPRRR